MVKEHNVFLDSHQILLWHNEDDGPENIIVADGENDDRENVVEL